MNQTFKLLHLIFLIFCTIGVQAQSTIPEAGKNPNSSLEKNEGKYYALVIAINNYSDEEIKDLKMPISDAEMFSSLLTSRYTFDSSNVKTLRDATLSQIVGALDYYTEVIRPSDNLLIFFSGRGKWDDVSATGYWLPSDASMNNKLKWLSNGTISDYLREIKSRHTLLIIDADYAGSIFKTRSAFSNPQFDLNTLYELPSRKAMTSVTLTDLPEQNTLVFYMIDRLRDNSLKYISSEQLFNSLRIAVINNSNTVPQYGEIRNVGNEGGDFIFIALLFDLGTLSSYHLKKSFLHWII